MLQATEIVQHLQKTLREFMIQIRDYDILDRSNFDRLEVLLDACPEDAIHPKFRNLLMSSSGSRGKFNADDTLEILDSLNALLETELLVSDLKTREGSDPDLLTFFSPDNKDRKLMVEKCDELRKLVSESSFLTPPFRNRLLKRISAMELEINKAKGLFDVLLGGVNDVGEALKKFGNDAKPLVDRVTEIASIGRRTSAGYAELPSPDEVKRLPSPDEKSGSDQ